MELLVALNRAVAEAAVQPADCTCDRVVDQVVEYINEHYNEPLTLDDLSERFFISKYHLLRKLTGRWAPRCTGTSCKNGC